MLIYSIFLFVFVKESAAEWEIPIDLHLDVLLQRVGGMPSLASWKYELPSYSSTSPPRPVETTSVLARLPLMPPNLFNCSQLLSSESLCVFNMSPGLCQSEAHTSSLFWSNERTICIKDKEPISCADATINKHDTFCQNVVTTVVRRGNDTTVIVGDIPFDEPVRQSFSDAAKSCRRLTKTMQTTELIEATLSPNKHCFPWTDLGVLLQNASSLCLLELTSSNCEDRASELTVFWKNQIGNPNLCGCTTCDVPIMWNLGNTSSKDSSTCRLPTTMQLTITRNQTQATALYIRLAWTAQLTKPHQNVILYSRITNIPHPSISAEIRWSTVKGLFWCPSENRCPSELLYPVYQLFQSNILNTVLLTLIALSLSIIIVRIQARKS